MNKKSLMLAAMAGLVIGSTAMAEEAKPAAAVSPATTTDSVLCYGVNACSAKGSCHGKVDTCSGKSGCQTEVACAGKNTCKGKGLVKMTKKECADKKGTAAI